MRISFFKLAYLALCAAFSTFSSLPVPKFKWEEKISSLMMPVFPIVGLVIGVFWRFAISLLILAEIPIMLKTAFFCVIPIVLTGFFHLDGFMDVADAVLSRRDLEKKREILKDSHVGSFAVLASILYFMFYFSASYSLLFSHNTGLLVDIFVFIPVFSRSICAIYLLGLPLMSQNGYAAMYRENNRKKQIVWLVSVVFMCFVGCVIFAGIIGLLVLISGLVFCSIVFIPVCFSLKGVNGDVSGCALVVTELACLMTLAVLQGVL